MTQPTDNEKLEVRTHESEMGLLDRSMDVDANELEIDGMTIKGVTIATETPVNRLYGEERLKLTEDSITNIDQFRANGISLIQGHDPNSRSLGTATNPKVVNGKLTADITFDPNYDKSVDIFKAITVGKQKKDLSIGYIVDRYTGDRMGETMLQSRTTDKLTLRHIGVVGRGSDPLSGFRRTDDVTEAPNSAVVDNNGEGGETNKLDNSTDKKMTKEVMPENSISKEQEVVTSEATPAPASAKASDLNQVRTDAVTLLELGTTHKVDSKTVQGWIKDGISPADASQEILKSYDQRSATEEVITPKPMYHEGTKKNPYEGLSTRGAIEALIANHAGTSNKMSEAAGIANEISQSFGGGSEVFKLPYEALETRAFQAGPANQGQQAIQQTVYQDKWIDYLEANTVSGLLGVDTMPNLRENVKIPKETNAITAGYIGENDPAVATDFQLGSISMSPKEVYAYTKIGNLASIQLPGIQARLEASMMRNLNIAIDRAILIGGGADEPKGISSFTTGDDKIDTPLPGAKDAATRKITIEALLDLTNQIENANVPVDELKFVTSPAVVNYLRKVKGSDGQYVWTDNRDSTTVMRQPGFIWGYPVYKTTNYRLPGDAGTDNRLLAGVFNYCISGFWGSTMDMEIGYNADDFARRQKSIILTARHDVAITQKAAFKSRSKIEV